MRGDRQLVRLREPEDRSLRQGPGGLILAGTMYPEYAAEYHQRVISGADLAEEVPGNTRAAFERVRRLHAYGVVFYDAYTLAGDLVWLVLDLALRERFLARYDHGVPLVHKGDGTRVELEIGRFDDLVMALERNGSYPASQWRLELGAAETMWFTGSFKQLLTWARKLELLPGQANRRLHPLFADARNRVAHPEGHAVEGSYDSARAIWDVAAVINRLWGADTPGSRLYPGPQERRPMVIGWNPTAGHRVMFRADLDRLPRDDDAIFIVVRGVERDPYLWDFDARFERTLFPAELLFGPGGRTEVAAWLAKEAPEPDLVEVQDRTFLVRVVDGTPDWPRRPEVAAGLPGSVRTSGMWHLVRADDPFAALLHERGPGGTPRPECVRVGECHACPVDVLAVGRWPHVSEQLASVDPERPPEVRVPPLFELAAG